MTPAVVILDAHGGSMTRYELSYGRAKKTHYADLPPDFPRPVEFSPELVELFLTHPDGQFYVGPPAPIPGGEPPSGAPAAMRAA